MGRKAAPQPLALQSDAALRSDDPPTAETTTTNTTTTTTSSSQGLSPAASRSPRSPRSPFHSRFSPLRPQNKKASPIAAITPATAAATKDEPVKHAPSDPSLEEDAPSLYSSISSAIESQPTPAPPPTTSSTTTTATTTTTTSSSSTQQQHQPASTAPHQPDTKKGTKNGFFHFSKPSKSFGHPPPHVHQQPRKDSEPRNQMMSRGNDGPGRPRHGDPSYSEHSLHKPPSTDPLRSDLSVSSAGDPDTASPQSTKKAKPKAFGRLHRSRSQRDKGGTSPELKELKPIPVPAHVPAHVYGNEPELHLNSVPLRTAPLNPDRSFRDMMGSAVRNRSEDRAPHRDSSATREHRRDKESRTQPSSLREGGGSAFLSNLKSSSTRAADLFSKNFLGKAGRGGGPSDRDAIDDENYQIKVLNLPLVEQTRLTRISKRLEDSRDKTEFWMPAFPWRAIDYLNYKGCEVEGLYRVPGSGPQIKKYQRKFDEQYDVNLFEDHDLYDINIIGSMLKAWLRELPEELFPKAAQDRIARECQGADEVPELLIEELSNLSPFNYYLLFAITCHLSLLLAHSDKNKMDFRNLCICFQPCMKIDAFCFKFLVCDWRDCWRGCKNEGKYIEEEYMLFDQPPPRGIAEPQKPRAQDSDNERHHLSSSDSSKVSAGFSSPPEQKARLKKKPIPHSNSNGSVVSTNSSISRNAPKLTLPTERELREPREPREPARGPEEREGERKPERRDLRPLSPIKPLSPMGF